MLNADDEAEFWVLYRKTADVVFRKAYRMCRGHRADAEDAHQNTYLRALRHWSTLSELNDKQRHAWLATTLMREVLQLWRAQYRSRETRNFEDVEWQEIVADVAADAGSLDDKDRYRKTCLAIAQLEGREQEVIALHCLAGYEIAEVAEMLGITSSTVRVHLHHGRAALRVMMFGEEGAADGER